MSLHRVSNRTQSNGFINKSVNFYSVNVLHPYANILVTLMYKVKTALHGALTYYETGFFASFTALALSTCNVGTSLPFPLSSPSRHFSQSSSLAPSLAVINSASVNNVTDCCSWLDHAVALPAYTATTPLVDHLVLMSSAKLASPNASNTPLGYVLRASDQRSRAFPPHSLEWTNTCGGKWGCPAWKQARVQNGHCGW